MFHGANLIPENLETGEYTINHTFSVSGLTPFYVWAYSGDLLYMSSVDYIDLSAIQSRLVVNGIHTSLSLIVATDSPSYQYMENALKISNQSEYVVAHFSVPSLAVNNNVQLIHQSYPRSLSNQRQSRTFFI